MKIIKYQTEQTGGPQAGVLLDGEIIGMGENTDIEDPGLASLLQRVLNEGVDVLSEELESNPQIERESADLLPPVDANGRVFCLGAIYTGHMEDTGLSLNFDPNQWIMPENTIIGPEDPIVLPERVAEKVKPAAELGLVIGKAGKYIDPMEANEHIAGYTISNDVTARTDWPGPMGYKMMDSFSPVGPYIRSADEVINPSTLEISMRLDGEEICRGNTAGMRFSLTFLVSYLSTIVELRPGDVISTGDPGGVQRPLAPDSTVEIEIEQVGTLTNSVEVENRD